MSISIFGPGVIDQSQKPQPLTGLSGTQGVFQAVASDVVTDTEDQRDRTFVQGRREGSQGGSGQSLHARAANAYQSTAQPANQTISHLSAEDIMMTDFPAVLPTTQVEDVLEVMRRYERPLLPVVGLSEQPLGWVDELTLRRRVDLPLKLSSPISERMQTTLFTLNAGASVKQVAYLLGRVGAPMVMVLSEQNTLVGLITPSELLWHLSPAQVSDTQG